MDLRLCLYALVALATLTTTAATIAPITITTPRLDDLIQQQTHRRALSRTDETPRLDLILQQTHRRALSSPDEDHIVDVEVSFYNDSKCDKPISENGEPLVSHWEIDSAEKYAQCRTIEEKGDGYGNHYQFYCHESGNEISGKLLCNPTCKTCLISTDDKKPDGTTAFPLGEMKLDECLSLGEGGDDGIYIKFIGECYDQKGVAPGTIVGITVACVAALLLIAGLCYLKRTRYNQTASWFSGGAASGGTATTEGVADEYNAPEYSQL